MSARALPPIAGWARGRAVPANASAPAMNARRCMTALRRIDISRRSRRGDDHLSPGQRRNLRREKSRLAEDLIVVLAQARRLALQARALACRAELQRQRRQADFFTLGA